MNIVINMLLTEIQKKLKKHASPEQAEQMTRVAPGAKNIYGIKMPLINELAKLAKEGGFELVEALWKAGAFEERLLAAKMIRGVAKRDPEKAIALVKKYSADIDNWALCDTLGMQSLKSINKSHPEEIFTLAGKLSGSKNMWQRRLSLVLVEDFCKKPEFKPAIKELIDLQRGDKEYYVKKAVVWLESSLNKRRK